MKEDTQTAQLRRTILKSVEDMDIETLKRIAYECRCEEMGIYPDHTYTALAWWWLKHKFSRLSQRLLLNTNSPERRSSKSLLMCVITCYTQDKSPNHNTPAGPMFSKDDTDFIDFLFGKLTCLTDTDMLDLQDDDSCCDHINFEQLTLFWTMIEEVMLDRWLLEQIEEEYDMMEIDTNMPREELSQEVMELLS